MRSLQILLKRITAGLRFRLTLTYVLFFAVLLSFLGVFIRETIRTLHVSQLRNLLVDDLGAVRGYLRIDKPKRRGQAPEPNWYYDPDIPDEALVVDRLRQVYMLANANGKALETSEVYTQLRVESAEDIRKAVQNRESGFKTLKDAQGVPYLVRSSIFTGDDDQRYYIAIGRSAAEEESLRQFTWLYGLMLPLMIISTAVLGWFMAGRALVPVNQLAETAQRITGANLAVQIPSRGSGDELDRLIEAFNLMIERLDQSFTQARQFSTDVSHELRTPLTAIRGQLEVALLAAKTPEQYQEAILNALQDVERLSKTIRALLLLSQAESGQLTLQKQAVDLVELVVDIVDQFQIPAEASQVSLVLRHQEPTLFEADKIQIERLVSNLLSNAVKYTPPGGSILVSVGSNGESAELIVTDTGIGIPADHLPYIFDRFYRVPRAKSRRGGSSAEHSLGLGLSFVAWIVRAHGGTLDVVSSPGEGTTFTVRIPRGSPETAPDLTITDSGQSVRIAIGP